MMVSLPIFLCVGCLLISLSLVRLHQLLEVAPRGQKNTGTIDLFYASNVRENWEALESLLWQAKKKRVDLIILTDVFQNPLSLSEQSAYTHAFRHVLKSFETDTAFSDIGPFIQSFSHDPSDDIVAISARKILKQIDEGRAILADKITRLKKILLKNEIDLLVVPGPFENLDLFKAIDPEIASYYVNLNTIEIKDLRILGIGGLNQIDENCPLYFQNRDYYEGTEEANSDLKKLFFAPIDLFVTYSPIRYFTDHAHEEKNVREYLSDHLPGKLILTSQAVPKNPMTPCVTATDANVIKGGYFGTKGQFWEIQANKDGLVHKQLSHL